MYLRIVTKNMMAKQAVLEIVNTLMSMKSHATLENIVPAQNMTMTNHAILAQLSRTIPANPAHVMAKIQTVIQTEMFTHAI